MLRADLIRRRRAPRPNRRGGDLLRVNAHLSLKAEALCRPGGHFEALLVREIDPNRIERSLESADHRYDGNAPDPGRAGRCRHRRFGEPQPSVVRAAAHVGVQFIDTTGVGAFRDVTATQRSVALVVLTAARWQCNVGSHGGSTSACSGGRGWIKIEEWTRHLPSPGMVRIVAENPSFSTVVGRDAQSPARSRRGGVVSLSDDIPVPQCCRTRFARLAAPAANEVGLAIAVGLGVRIGQAKPSRVR
jgi:hypothetical protein